MMVYRYFKIDLVVFKDYKFFEGGDFAFYFIVFISSVSKVIFIN